MKSIYKLEIKTIVIPIFIIFILYLTNYYIPKRNATKTLDDFEKYCKKENDILVNEFSLNEISLTDPWLFGITRHSMYTDKKTDSMYQFYFPNINFPSLNISRNIRAFKCCRLNVDDLKYDMTEEIIFYGVIKDTLYYDDFETSLEKWNSMKLDRKEIDSISSLIIKKANDRKYKIVKNDDHFKLYYRSGNSFEELPFFWDDNIPYKFLFDEYNNELQSQNRTFKTLEKRK
jgi:hypothetical protein